MIWALIQGELEELLASAFLKLLQRTKLLQQKLRSNVLITPFFKQETTPNPQPSEEEKTEPAPSQEVASPEQYIKHPLQNR